MPTMSVPTPAPLSSCPFSVSMTARISSVAT